MTLDDIAAAVRARCAAAADFALALPGGAWLDRGPDAPEGDYAVFGLEKDGEPEWFSDSSYLQGYTLRMVAYTTQGRAGGSTSQAAQLAMAAALNPNPTGWAALRAGAVNCCLPQAFTGQHAPDLREGKDVFCARGEWRLLIEGSIYED